MAGEESREAAVREIRLLRQLLDDTKAKKRRDEANRHLRQLSGTDNDKQARAWAREKLVQLGHDNPHDDREDSASIRTASGGLPTLGKGHK